MPAAAHSAGSSILARRVTESAVVIDEAADGANPKVTFLPSHTRPQCGQGRVRRAGAQGVRPANGPAVRGQRQFLRALGQAATSKWHR